MSRRQLRSSEKPPIQQAFGGNAHESQAKRPSKFCRNAGKRHCIPIKITNFAPVITLKPDEGGRVVADIDGKAFTL